MIAGARAPLLLLLATVLIVALLAVLGLELTGDDLGELWQEIALPVMVLAACLAVLTLLGLASSLVRIRNRRRRPMSRYQLVLSQADEARLRGGRGQLRAARPGPA